ncbi:MAG: lytic transglycosylase domain-containing protein [Steroidobacteraceae bacterium]
MADTVIDSLIVTLGLDASNFTREQKKAAESLVKTKNSMGNTAREMAGAFRRVGLEFAGLFFGARSAGDIVHKFAELNSQMADLGYNSRQLGESAANLRLYQQIAGGFGGSAAGVTQMVSGLEQGMFNLKYMGQMSGQMAAWLRFGGGLPPTNAQGGIDVLKTVSDLRARLHGMGPVDQNQILTALGVSPGIRNAIMATRQQYEHWVRSQRESAKQMADGTTSAQSLQRAWRNLQYSLDGAAATVLTNLTPALKSMLGNLAKIAPTELENLAKWVKSHGPEVTAFFGELNSIIGGIAESMKILGPAFHYTFGVVGKAIGDTAGWLVNKGRENQGWLTRGTYQPTVMAAAAKYGVPVPILNALIQRESGWDPDAVSKKGAIGLTQLMPGTAASLGVNPHNPVEAIYGGAHYLAEQYKRFGTWQAALIGYNEGPTAYAKGVRYPSAQSYASGIMAHAGASSIAHHTTHITTGDIHINAPNARDSLGIARSLRQEVDRQFRVFQADNGVTP